MMPRALTVRTPSLRLPLGLPLGLPLQASVQAVRPARDSEES